MNRAKTAGDELISVRHSGAALTIGVSIAIAFAVLSVLAIIDYEAIASDAAGYEGRRSGFRELIAPAAVALPWLFVAVALAFGLGVHTWRHAPSGERLKILKFQVNVPRADAARVLEVLQSPAISPLLSRLSKPTGGETMLRVLQRRSTKESWGELWHQKGKKIHEYPRVSIPESSYDALRIKSTRLNEHSGDNARRAALRGALDPFLRE